MGGLLVLVTPTTFLLNPNLSPTTSTGGDGDGDVGGDDNRWDSIPSNSRPPPWRHSDYAASSLKKCVVDWNGCGDAAVCVVFIGGDIPANLPNWWVCLNLICIWMLGLGVILEDLVCGRGLGVTCDVCVGSFFFR